MEHKSTKYNYDYIVPSGSMNCNRQISIFTNMIEFFSYLWPQRCIHLHEEKIIYLPHVGDTSHGVGANIPGGSIISPVHTEHLYNLSTFT